MSKPIFVINGPNLNLLGTREPEVYGTQTLDDVKEICIQAAGKFGREVTFVQSNIEGELVDFIQQAGRESVGIVINPAAYTHTSVAIHDALKAVVVPSVEIHLSQPAKRESFRRRSYVAEAVQGTVSGFGVDSYVLGLQALSNLI